MPRQKIGDSSDTQKAGENILETQQSMLDRINQALLQSSQLTGTLTNNRSGGGQIRNINYEEFDDFDGGDDGGEFGHDDTDAHHNTYSNEFDSLSREISQRIQMRASQVQAETEPILLDLPTIIEEDDHEEDISIEKQKQIKKTAKRRPQTAKEREDQPRIQSPLPYPPEEVIHLHITPSQKSTKNSSYASSNVAKPSDQPVQKLFSNTIQLLHVSDERQHQDDLSHQQSLLLQSNSNVNNNYSSQALAQQEYQISRRIESSSEDEMVRIAQGKIKKKQQTNSGNTAGAAAVAPPLPTSTTTPQASVNNLSDHSNVSANGLIFSSKTVGYRSSDSELADKWESKGDFLTKRKEVAKKLSTEVIGTSNSQSQRQQQHQSRVIRQPIEVDDSNEYFQLINRNNVRNSPKESTAYLNRNHLVPPPPQKALSDRISPQSKHDMYNQFQQQLQYDKNSRFNRLNELQREKLSMEAIRYTKNIENQKQQEIMKKQKAQPKPSMVVLSSSKVALNKSDNMQDYQNQSGTSVSKSISNNTNANNSSEQSNGYLTAYKLRKKQNSLSNLHSALDPTLHKSLLTQLSKNPSYRDSNNLKPHLSRSPARSPQPSQQRQSIDLKSIKKITQELTRKDVASGLELAKEAKALVKSGNIGEVINRMVTQQQPLQKQKGTPLKNNKPEINKHETSDEPMRAFYQGIQPSRQSILKKFFPPESPIRKSAISPIRSNTDKIKYSQDAATAIYGGGITTPLQNSSHLSKKPSQKNLRNMKNSGESSPCLPVQSSQRGGLIPPPQSSQQQVVLRTLML